jgi:mono/diheme cytochrome c family protein
LNRISQGLFLWGQAFLFFAVLLSFVQTPAAGADTATPLAGTPEPTPTIDRLAPPPTVEEPTQADEGAYLYWLNCQPCHGDVGQGLTDEWRAQYPPEEQYCWGRGCHGERPYENGFTLPEEVPALIGEGSLARFETMGQVYHYSRVTMPFNAPASLDEAEYLAITAFLAREHDAWQGIPFDADTVDQARLRGVPAELPPAVHQEPVVAVETETGAPGTTPTNVLWWLLLFFLSLSLLVGGSWLWIRRIRGS